MSDDWVHGDLPVAGLLIALSVVAAPPEVAGHRVVGGQEVETSPRWDRPFVARSGEAFGPPVRPGLRHVGGQLVETNPNWGRSFASVGRFASGPARGPSIPQPPRPKPPQLTYRGMTNKFTANMFSGQISAPTRDLWLSTPLILR